MIKMDFKGPSARDLIKSITTAVEKQISEKAQQAARPFGGVRIRFRHKSDGSLDTVEFEGSEKAIEAANSATVTRG